MCSAPLTTAGLATASCLSDIGQCWLVHIRQCLIRDSDFQCRFCRFTRHWLFCRAGETVQPLLFVAAILTLRRCSIAGKGGSYYQRECKCDCFEFCFPRYEGASQWFSMKGKHPVREWSRSHGCTAGTKFLKCRWAFVMKRTDIIASRRRVGRNIQAQFRTQQ